MANCWVGTFSALQPRDRNREDSLIAFIRELLSSELRVSCELSPIGRVM